MKNLKSLLASSVVIGGLLMSSSVFAIEFKCFAFDSVKGGHIILVDTTDIKDALRAAKAATVENQFGRAGPVISVEECKLASESFSSSKAKKLDKEMPR